MWLTAQNLNFLQLQTLCVIMIFSQTMLNALSSTLTYYISKANDRDYDKMVITYNPGPIWSSPGLMLLL